jgi:hypothetical protein
MDLSKSAAVRSKVPNSDRHFVFFGDCDHRFGERRNAPDTPKFDCTEAGFLK